MAWLHCAEMRRRGLFKIEHLLKKPNMLGEKRMQKRSARRKRSLSRFKWEAVVGSELEANQDSFGVGQVTDDPSTRQRLFPHDGRHGDDLVVPRDLRILQQIDDLDMISAGKMCLADLFEIVESHG